MVPLPVGADGAGRERMWCRCRWERMWCRCRWERMWAGRWERMWRRCRWERMWCRRVPVPAGTDVVPLPVGADVVPPAGVRAGGSDCARPPLQRR